MKVNLVTSIITVAFTALIVFGFYTWCNFEDLKLLLTIFSSISILLTLGTTIAVSMPQKRTSANTKVVSGIFLLIVLISNAIFCGVTKFTSPAYIITNGAILLTWFALCYGINRANSNE